MQVALDLSIPSHVRHIEGVVHLVRRTCADLALPSRSAQLCVPVALSEALANAILYGNRQVEAKQVRVRASVGERVLVLEVHDEGAGFDLDSCTNDPTAPENLEREDGRGLFLMRALMDHVERFVDGGNVVRMTIGRQ